MEANKEENFKLSLQTTFYEFAEELVRNHQTKFGAFLFRLKEKSNKERKIILMWSGGVTVVTLNVLPYTFALTRFS